MISILIWSIILFVSLVILSKSADLFVDNSEKLGIILGIPNFIIGITILAIGTSLPELISSLFSISFSHTEFVVSNVLGANISNLLLNLGVSYLLAKQMTIKWDIFNGDAVLLVGSVAMIVITLMDKSFSRIDGVICLLGYLIYIYHSIISKKEKQVKEDLLIPNVDKRLKPKLNFKLIFFIVLGAVGIYFGAKYTLDSVIKISAFLGLKDTSVLAMSVVAIGTSLPELIVSIKATRKNNFEMALGNILGSNIFNTFIVLGVSGVVAGTLKVSEIIFNITLPVLIIATTLFLTSVINKKSNRSEGLMFLIIYGLFLLKIFGIY